MSTYAEAVAFYELSRLEPKQHLIDSLAIGVLEAAKLGAAILDGDVDLDAATYQVGFRFTQMQVNAPEHRPSHRDVARAIVAALVVPLEGEQP